MKTLFRLMIMIPISIGVTWAAGHDAVIETCNGCHGDGGVSQDANVSTIAGLSEFYHGDQLYFYRDGDRTCAADADPDANMCTAAADLSDDQIDAIAAHYAEMDFVPAQQEFDADLVAAGEAVHERDCAMCHSDGGSSPDDDAGILAGQWMGYLRQTLGQYRAGGREQPAPMKKKIDALSEGDVEALLQFYASQQ